MPPPKKTGYATFNRETVLKNFLANATLAQQYTTVIECFTSDKSFVPRYITKDYLVTYLEYA